jgi:glycosyltransferase involved in cell wall biosynthesis
VISTPVKDPNEISCEFNEIPVKLKKVTSISFLVKLLIMAPSMKLSHDTIIHTHRPDFLLPFILFFHRNPKICTLHGIPDIGIKTRKKPIIWKIYNIIERFCLKRTDRLIAVDEGTKKYYSNRYPGLKERIVTIPVGIDPEIFKPKDKKRMRNNYGFKQDEIIILYVGRFSIEKGLDILIKGFREVNYMNPESRLVLLGEGLQSDDLKDVIRDQNIHNITFMAPVKHEIIPEIMSCADIFALTSSFEGMPTVVLEAMACGIPVVATEVGDVKKVVLEGKTGYIIQRREPEYIKKAILKLIENKDSGFSEYCQKVATRYSWNNIIPEIIDIYKTL